MILASRARYFDNVALVVVVLAALTAFACSVQQPQPHTPGNAMAADLEIETPTPTAPHATTSGNQSPTAIVSASAESPDLPTETTPLIDTPLEIGSQESPSPSTDSALSGKRKRVIALDPGHGGPEPGAVTGNLLEKDLNLAIALKLADMLRAEDYEVVLTRDEDRAVSPEYKGNGYGGALVKDLQARIDIANDADADLFVSIHNNGSADPYQAGTEVWYDPLRPFADRNLALAKLTQGAILDRLHELGYPAFDRGTKDDSSFRIFQGRTYNIYVLGPGDGPRPHVATKMPGVLGESLILSNPADAAMLRKETTLDAIAAGYQEAIDAYFELYP